LIAVLKEPIVTISQMSSSSSFHNLGAMAENARSPNVLRVVVGTVRRESSE
jgi:hypothetical protein